MNIWQCAAGDTFDLISLWTYGDEKYAAELIWQNPQYAGVLEFSGGEEIILPEIEIPDTDYPETTAPWRR